MNRWIPRACAFLVVLPALAGFAACFSPGGAAAAAHYWWRDGSGWVLLGKTLAFAAAGATVGTAFGWVLALALPAAGGWSRRGALLVACLPLLVPSSLMGTGWIMALGRDAVVTNLLRPALGSWTPTVYDWPAAAGATGLRYLGVAALVIATPAAHGRRRSTQAAERVFRIGLPARLRLRLSATAGAAAAAWLLLLLLVQSDHILPGLFLVHTFGTQVLVEFNALMSPAGAAVLAAVPAVVALLPVLVLLFFLRRRRPTWSASPPDSDGDGRRHGARDILPGCLVAATLTIAVGLPVAGILVKAQSASNVADAAGAAREELAHSLLLAFTGAAFTVALAAAIADAAAAAFQAGRPRAWPLLPFVLAVPASLPAVGVVSLFDLPPLRPLRDTDVPLVCGYAARFAPVAAVVLFAAWSRESAASRLAADVHGVPPRARVTRLTLPSRLPAAAAAALLAALLILAELETSLILVPPGPTTLGVRLHSMIHTAPDHLVSSLAVVTLLLPLGLSAAAGVVVAVVRTLARSRWMIHRPAGGAA